MQDKRKGRSTQLPPESGAQPENSEPLEQSVAQDGGEINAADGGADGGNGKSVDVSAALEWTNHELANIGDRELELARAALPEAAHAAHRDGDLRLADGCGDALDRVTVEIERRHSETNAVDDPLAIEWLRDAKIKPYDWLEHGWLAREAITLFTSEPKVGKSTLAAYLAANVSNMPGGGMALMCYLESAASIEHWPRMLAAGADKDRVARMVKPITDSGASFAMNVRKAIIANNLRPDLIVVDPLATVAGDTSRTKEARATMSAFQGLADDFNCAMR